MRARVLTQKREEATASFASLLAMQCGSDWLFDNHRQGNLTLYQFFFAIAQDPPALHIHDTNLNFDSSLWQVQGNSH